VGRINEGRVAAVEKVEAKFFDFAVPQYLFKVEALVID
jgi:hypothetical protein